jgi:hypothetical protein
MRFHVAILSTFSVTMLINLTPQFASADGAVNTLSNTKISSQERLTYLLSLIKTQHMSSIADVIKLLSVREPVFMSGITGMFVSAGTTKSRCCDLTTASSSFSFMKSLLLKINIIFQKHQGMTEVTPITSAPSAIFSKTSWAKT